MKEFLLKNKLVIMLITVAVLLTTIGLSYAFMPNDIVLTSEGNANVQVMVGDGFTIENVRRVDKLSEINDTNYTLQNISSDIVLTVDEQIDTTYDLYYNIKVNNYLDGTTTPTAKVIVKVFNPSGTEITSISGLTRVTAGSITGFDLTDYTGSIELAKDYAIATSSTTIQNWQVKIYLYDTAGLSNISNTLFDSELNIEKQRFSAKDYILGHNGGQAAIEAKAEPNFAQIATTDEGMFAVPDTYGTSYYYRGAVSNNWLLFNGIYWRIVNISGNGSLKLIYSGTVPPTESDAIIMTNSNTEILSKEYNSSNANNAFVGYRYTIGERQGTSTNSVIAATLDAWYENNLLLVNHMISDNLFCYDRSLAKEGFQYPDLGYTNGEFKGDGLGTNPTAYGAIERITASSSSWSPGGSGPDLLCSSKIDSFTKDDVLNGNGKLSQKIGLLSIDEAVMAGLAPANLNSANYLYTSRYYWLGTPYAYIDRFFLSSVWVIHSDGTVGYYTVDEARGVRPVININGNIPLTGKGTWNDPYVVTS